MINMVSGDFSQESDFSLKINESCKNGDDICYCSDGTVNVNLTPLGP